MSYIYAVHKGMSYGDGYLQGSGQIGQVVALTGSDLFAVNTDAGQPSFGLLKHDTQNGEMPTIFCQHGIYETDAFEGPVAAGDDLKAGPSGFLTSGVTDGEQVIARAVAVNGSTLKFQLLI